MKEPFDDNLICPVSGENLWVDGDRLATKDGTHQYQIENGIIRLFADTETQIGDSQATPAATREVQEFYAAEPFPNYNEFDNIGSFVRHANQAVFSKLLGQQIPPNANVLEVGCGTGQLSNYLAATTMSRIYATDLTIESLELGHAFAAKNNIHGNRFIQMNLFAPCIKPESMDVVISNGVLHHTANTEAAFQSIAKLVRPGGFIVLGLYNWLGRTRTFLRRRLYKTIGEPALLLDPVLRANLSAEKRRAWISDQYLHPVEHSHSISEVMAWFEEAEIFFMASLPKIIGDIRSDEDIFAPVSSGTRFDRIWAEFSMLFTGPGGEGGVFIMIGQKKPH